MHKSRLLCLQYAIFEPGTRNTGTAIAGKNIANPVAMINASIDMLNHLGHKGHAKVIEEAVYQTVVVDAIRTPGLFAKYSKSVGVY